MPDVKKERVQVEPTESDKYAEGRRLYAIFLESGKLQAWIDFTSALPTGVYLLRSGAFYTKNPVRDYEEVVVL